jgi:EAL domain-containing protein (putative c-di-GMP-specific phosphodiesterase class I)/GAF domain-containing protein
MASFLPRIQRETARLDALRRLNLLDTPPSEAFDRIARMAAELFKVPIAAVSLTDSARQWFKARVGIDHGEIPRLKAPCAQVAEEAQVLVVRDLLDDASYRDSPLARSGVRFYAGAPLLTRDGHCLGAMCVLGNAPRTVTEGERTALVDLATMAMAQIELQHAIGRVDAFSGLPNRTRFIEDFRSLALHRPRGEARLAVLVSLGSAEQFGSAERVLGARYLDEVMRQAVRMLEDGFGAAGTLYHLAPTEFAFLAAPGTDAVELCVDLDNWLRRRAAAAMARFVTTARIGVVPFHVGAATDGELLRNLHSALQHAFDDDRGVSMFSPEQDAVYRRRFWLINEFGAALDSVAGGRKGQLRLVFQPKVDLADGSCIGAEALLRWTHPEAGEVSPGEFIPIIERTAMIRATTRWVLEAAMHQLAQWHADGLELQLSVNVSAANLLEPDFCVRIVDGLRRHGLPPASLALEITESALMLNPRLAMATLHALDAAGVHLAIDDFGTGYSSLAYLQSLPAQVVKIDRSFVLDIEHDARKRALVAAMIKLSHDLGHRVVAEGVETAEVLDVLREAACDEAQGYLYAKPLAPGDFVAWLGAGPGVRPGVCNGR